MVGGTGSSLCLKFQVFLYSGSYRNNSVTRPCFMLSDRLAGMTLGEIVEPSNSDL